MSLHPSVQPVFVSKLGIELRATKNIPCGTVIWHPSLEALQLTPEQLCEASEFTYGWLDELGYRLANSNLILPSGGACFFNHSCDPNVVDYGMDFGLAVRDISKDESVVIDYRTFVFDPPFRFPCKCNAQNCRGFVTNDPASEPLRLRAPRQVDLVVGTYQPLHSSLIESSKTYMQLLRGAGSDTLVLHSICEPPTHSISCKSDSGLNDQASNRRPPTTDLKEKKGWDQVWINCQSLSLERRFFTLWRWR